MNIPPVVGLVIALSLGIVIGGGLTYQHYSKELLKVESKLRTADNKAAKAIKAETDTLLTNSELNKTIQHYNSRPLVTCKDLSNEQIDTICIKRYVPPAVMQSIRSQIATARGRVN